MLQIPLSIIPNQTLSVVLDGKQYDLAFYLTENIMAVDMARDGEVILTGQRIVAGFPIIPYRYLESGNFILDTANDELPDYRQFGVTQFLIYASIAELASLRAGT